MKLSETERERQIIILFSICAHTVSVLQDDSRELSYGVVTVKKYDFVLDAFFLLLLCFEIII